MAGKFELYQSPNKEWRWRLKAANGEIIAIGEGYKSKQGAQGGIKSVQENAPTASVVEV